MEVRTTRFGSVEIEPGDVLHFPAGLLGLGDCTHWVLLAEDQNDALGWLQSTQYPEAALAVVSPQRFVPGFQLRVSRSELGPVLCESASEAHVLAIVNTSEQGITLNLKAPLVIDLHQRLGRQVIANGDYSVQHEIGQPPARLKMSA